MYWKRIKHEKQSLEPRAAHICERVKRKIYLFGGWNGTTAMNDLDVFYLDSLEWIRLQPKGDIPSIRNNHASCVIDNKIYIHGGHNGIDWLDDFFVLDTENLIWKEIKTLNNPSLRACHTISKINKKIYLFGGYNGEESFNDMEIFDIETFNWYKPETKGFIPSPRNAHSATVVNKFIYIFGGFCNNTYYNDLYIFNTQTHSWTKPILQGILPKGIRGHTSTFSTNKMYIFGGYDGNTRINDLYIMSLDDIFFNKVNVLDEIICPRQKHSATLLNNQQIFIFGGYAGDKWLNSIDILNVKLLEEDFILEKTRNIYKINFSALINNPSFSDITFLIGENKIFGHKCIICARCEYFKNMFFNYLKESKQQYIEIKNYTFQIFFMLIEFIYASLLRTTDWRILVQLYELADAYSFQELKSVCEEYLVLEINNENAIDLLILGYLCNSPALENLSSDYIKSNNKRFHKNSLNKLIEYPSLMTKIIKNLSY